MDLKQVKRYFMIHNFISGLGTGSYFVHRVDDNKFNLSLTRKDSLLNHH